MSTQHETLPAGVKLIDRPGFPVTVSQPDNLATIYKERYSEVVEVVGDRPPYPPPLPEKETLIEDPEEEQRIIFPEEARRLILALLEIQQAHILDPELNQYAQEMLDESLLDQIEEHLSLCKPCRHRLRLILLAKQAYRGSSRAAEFLRSHTSPSIPEESCFTGTVKSVSANDVSLLIWTVQGETVLRQLDNLHVVKAMCRDVLSVLTDGQKDLGTHPKGDSDDLEQEADIHKRIHRWLKIGDDVTIKTTTSDPKTGDIISITVLKPEPFAQAHIPEKGGAEMKRITLEDTLRSQAQKPRLPLDEERAALSKYMKAPSEDHQEVRTDRRPSETKRKED